MEMGKTVNEVSKLTGVSVRTLHFYDTIGLLAPSYVTDSGYRLYDDNALERLSDILLFRELEFPLKEIKEILDRPGFDRQKALTDQIALLKLKKKHIETLIQFADEIQKKEKMKMNFEPFDNTEIEKYKEEAKQRWGNTDAYAEYAKKNANRSTKEEADINTEFMKVFETFSTLMQSDPASDEVQKQVKVLQDYITAHFYTCKKEILSGLGQMYAAEGPMNENIDKAGGKGTGVFVSKAIGIYCK